MLKYAVKLLIMAVANAAAIFIMNLNFNTSHVKVYPLYFRSFPFFTSSFPPTFHYFLTFLPGTTYILFSVSSIA